MPRDPYIDFATLYDEWQALYPKPFSLALAPRIERAVHRWGVPAAVLGDVACGTGTFANWWARRYPSWRVYGTDISGAMLKAAREAAKSMPQRGGSRVLRFVRQDLADLALPEPAGLLTCLFDSVNHVTKPAALARIFRRAHEALLPGGLFTFDLIDDESFSDTFSGYSISSGPTLYVGMEMEMGSRGGADIGEAVFTFFRRQGADWRRLQFRLQERRWRKAEIRTLARAAGLTVLDVDLMTPEADPDVYVPRQFWVLRRRP